MGETHTSGAIALEQNHRAIVDLALPKILDRMESRDEIPEDLKRKIVEGFEQVVSIMGGAMKMGTPELLDYQAHWASHRLPVEGFSIDDIIFNFIVFEESVREVLDPEDADQVCSYSSRLISKFRGE